MIIAVASGKGGTGKTMIATSLAIALSNTGKEVKLLDCDVEGPNTHIFFPTSKAPLSKERINLFYPVIDETKCDYCGKCQELCQFKAIVILKGATLVFDELCHSCGGCKLVCPKEAISYKPKELGDIIEIVPFSNLHLIQGRLKIGQPLSPPLIKKVRKKRGNEDVTIIDSPPGTSCPMIAATKGVDYTLLVTEPTPFGLHDLILAVETLKKLGQPFGIIINRSDSRASEIIEYSKTEDIEILMEIPFKKEIAKGYAEGKTLIEMDPSWKDKFLQMFEAIKVGGIN